MVDIEDLFIENHEESLLRQWYDDGNDDYAVDYVACDVHDHDEDGSDYESPITPSAYLSMPTKDTSHETTKPRLFQCQIDNEKR